MQPGERVAADMSAGGFCEFVTASPSSYHAAKQIVDGLLRSGFTEHSELDSWQVAPGSSGIVRRGGAVLGWRVGNLATATSPARIYAAHTDSPGFRVKPVADNCAAGWQQLNVEVYGGPLLTTWFDRDLEIAGEISLRDGTTRLVRTGAVARIPNLAIHLDRTAGTQQEIAKQRHTQPVLSVADTCGDGQFSAAPALTAVAAAAGVSEDQIAGWDLCLADTQAPQTIGVTGDLIASGRLDNLTGTFAGFRALVEAEPPVDGIVIAVAFDHEEVGSETFSGAAGDFLSSALDRIYAGLGADSEQRLRARAASWIMSADAGHGVHPNYPEKHDPVVRPMLGAGPLLKVNANQRYATSAAGAAMVRGLAETAGVAVQSFVSHNDIPCGSTVGPLCAVRTGIRTVDVGVPLLGMHSVRELAHTRDVAELQGLARAFFEDVA